MRLTIYAPDADTMIDYTRTVVVAMEDGHVSGGRSFDTHWSLLDTPAPQPHPGFAHFEEWETGQPNGLGVIESSDTREWYTDARVTHKRLVHTYIGPWEAVERPKPKPVEEVPQSFIVISTHGGVCTKVFPTKKEADDYAEERNALYKPEFKTWEVRELTIPDK